MAEEPLPIFKKQAEEMQGMFSKAANVSQDVWDNMSTLDRMALLSAPLPVVGDIIGAAADAVAIYKEPSVTNIALGAVGLLPFVPGASVTRTAQKAFTNLRNDIPGFYAPGGELGRVGAFGKTLPEGLRNLAQARYGPESRAIQNEFNISVADQRAAREALRVSEKVTTQLKPLEKQIKTMKETGKAYTGKYRKVKSGKDKGKTIPVETKEFEKLTKNAQQLRSTANAAGKKAMGQLNQSRSMINQYGTDKGFLKNIDEVDHVKTFKSFNSKDYFDTVEDLVPTGIGREGVEEIFNKIKTHPDIGMNPKKNYQMNIRKVHTGSAGELDPGMSAKVYGNLSLNNIKERVFSGGKGYNSDKTFLNKLEKAGVNVLNPDAVLKGKPAIITGSGKSDAWELGGVNYMSAINKRGQVTTIVNDEHDLGRLPERVRKITDEIGKLPGADRYMNVSEPIVYDLVKGKKLTAAQVKAKNKFQKKKQQAEQRAIENYKKIPGVNLSGKIPAGFKTKEQWGRAQAVANLQPTSRDFGGLFKEAVIFGPSRVGRPLAREEEGQQ